MKKSVVEEERDIGDIAVPEWEKDFIFGSGHVVKSLVLHDKHGFNPVAPKECVRIHSNGKCDRPAEVLIQDKNLCFRCTIDYIILRRRLLRDRVDEFDLLVLGKVLKTKLDNTSILIKSAVEDVSDKDGYLRVSDFLNEVEDVVKVLVNHGDEIS